MPVGAFGGRREIMEYLSPLGPVYQAGTLSGNPLALAAGAEMLKALNREGFYTELEEKSQYFESLLRPTLDKYSDHISYNRVGSLSTIFFRKGGVSSYAEASECDTELYARYFRLMLSEGVYLPPSQFECMFISMAHTQADLEHTARAISKSLETLFA